MTFISSMQKAELHAFLKESIREIIQPFIQELNINPASKEEFTTVSDTSKIYKVSKQTFYNWIKTGKIKKHKIGGRTLLKREEILNFIS